MQDVRIDLWELVSTLAQTFDMMSPELAEHSTQVAYLSLRISEEMKLPFDDRRDIAIAGALHDIGAFSLGNRLGLLAFEEGMQSQHSVAGYLLLREFQPFSHAASIIERHHQDWRNGDGSILDGKPVPIGSHIIHLADRVAVSLTREREILEQIPRIYEHVAARKGDRFNPECVEALRRLAEKDYVWLEIGSRSAEGALRRNLAGFAVDLDSDALMEFARVLSRIIDFKSGFTATHSSGVAAVGNLLAERVGFSRQECRMFEIAAFLHDVGKLAVPSEILDKPGKLTASEWFVMRTHVYYTYKILQSIDSISTIASWSSLHQERLDGSGYPFRVAEDDIPLGARIMAVADVFTGLCEDRPYRRGMGRDAALGILTDMTSRRELDGSLVRMLVGHYEDFERVRLAAQGRAAREYDDFRASLATGA